MRLVDGGLECKVCILCCTKHGSLRMFRTHCFHNGSEWQLMTHFCDVYINVIYWSQLLQYRLPMAIGWASGIWIVVHVPWFQGLNCTPIWIGTTVVSLFQEVLIRGVPLYAWMWWHLAPIPNPGRSLSPHSKPWHLIYNDIVHVSIHRYGYTILESSL